MIDYDSLQFTGKILAGHKQAAVEVPFDPAAKWGVAATAIFPGRRGFKINGRLNGNSFQSAIVPRSRRFWLLLDDETLKTADVAIGESVEISLELWHSTSISNSPSRGKRGS